MQTVHFPPENSTIHIRGSPFWNDAVAVAEFRTREVCEKDVCNLSTIPGGVECQDVHDESLRGKGEHSEGASVVDSSPLSHSKHHTASLKVTK